MLFPLLRRKIRRVRRAARGKALSAQTVLPVAGRPLPLSLVQGPTTREGCLVTPEALVVYLPTPLSGRAALSEARTVLRLWFKKEARTLFPALVARLAAQMEVRPGAVIVTDTRGRWGSCNYRNDIRLNWRLLLVPEEQRDYVIAHELAHIAHKNHSAAYWAFLGRFMPDFKARRAALRAFELKWEVPRLL